MIDEGQKNVFRGKLFEIEEWKCWRGIYSANDDNDVLIVNDLVLSNEIFIGRLW